MSPRYGAVVAVVALTLACSTGPIPPTPACLDNDARVQFTLDSSGVACPTADAIEHTTWAYFGGRDVAVTVCHWTCAAWACELRPDLAAYFVQVEDGSAWEELGFGYEPGVAACP
jgi:hypothetical protein